MDSLIKMYLQSIYSDFNYRNNNYIQQAPLPPELMNICISYLYKEEKNILQYKYSINDIFCLHEHLSPSGYYDRFFYTINGLKQGEYASFWTNSETLHRRYHYVNGDLHGKYEEYDRKGCMIFTQTYHKGRLHGAYEKFYGSGCLYTSGCYKNGRQDGIWREYYDTDDRRVKKEMIYKDDNLDGDWYRYSYTGDILEHRLYKNGQRRPLYNLSMFLKN